MDDDLELPLTRTELNDLGNEEQSRASTWRQLKLFARIQFLIRKRNRAFVAIWIFSVFMINSLSTLDSLNHAASSDVKAYPIVPFQSQFNDWITRYDKIVVYPRSLITDFLFSHVFVDYVNSIDELIRETNQNETRAIGFSINYSRDSVRITQYTSRLWVSDHPILDRMESIFAFYGISVRLSTRKYPTVSCPQLDPMSFLFLMHVPYAIIMVMVKDAELNQAPRDSRFFFLLRVHGLSPLVMWCGFMIVHFIEQIPVAIMLVYTFCYVISLNLIHSVSLFCFSIFMMIFALAMQQEFVCAIFTAKNSLSVYFSLRSFVLFFVTFLIPYVDTLHWFVRVILMVLLPEFPFMSLMKIMLENGTVGVAVNWSSLLAGQTVNCGICLSLQLASIVVMSFLNFLVHMCGAVVYGMSPVGWKNILKLRYWKKALSTKRHFHSTSTPLKVEHLTKIYSNHSVTAVNDLSLNIEPGDVLITIGPNGSGKSTLISILAGLQEPTSGSMSIQGELVDRDVSVLYDRLGIVFQHNSLVDNLTVREHLELFSELTGTSRERVTEDVSVIAESFEMNTFLDSFASTLSGGQQRVLCVAIAMIKRPSFIIMDEPTAGVDVQKRQIVWKAIRDRPGITGLVTCHSVEEGEVSSNRIMVMSKGNVAFLGTASEMRKKYKCGYYITFIDENVDMDDVLEFIQRYEPSAEMHFDRPRSVVVPDTLEMADLLEHLEMNKETLGVTTYTIHVESLENTLWKLILETEEANPS